MTPVRLTRTDPEHLLRESDLRRERLHVFLYSILCKPGFLVRYSLCDDDYPFMRLGFKGKRPQSGIFFHAIRWGNFEWRTQVSCGGSVISSASASVLSPRILSSSSSNAAGISASRPLMSVISMAGRLGWGPMTSISAHGIDIG